ncbi:murein DD-endopeptidase MepM/ murein hydrolase activator NlpD [Pseudorhizobium tarimense]|uniref:Murein DD-endopeptidase MepM/ murein hydrolase activator NlpD n=2 Tax=Pseudorhizobium tarimense TaxID=1079109 RepID=A0ABV2HAB2_9HYPH|nr:M23 family metallopeptidase [Pseudorhizobium tarimense]MCJ8520518.1 peptidoglycan DD-metalloendopeptidase family protein [Pseudorhizobium tarimense]
MLRIAGALLLASAATGCSSDATRFSGLFSDTDSLTTASIPQRQGSGAYGQAPTPRGDLGGGMATAPSAGYGTVAPSAGQAYPANSGYASVASPARSAAAPAAVQRVELAPPGGAAAAPASQDFGTRQQAMAQPFPSSQPVAPSAAPARAKEADNITTGTVKTSAGWSTVNAPRVTLKAGESAETLSRRYGVPEREILKANNGRLLPGQSVIIPTFGPASNSAKVAAGEIDLQDKAPAPVQQQEQKVAVLPGSARDKGMAEPAKLTPPAGAGGTYTVKPGDTLTKIARANGVSVDELKAANGLSTENIRIGQVLKLSGSAAPAVADPVQTASVPKKEQPQPEQTASAPTAPAAPTAQVQAAAPAKTTETASISEASLKSDDGAAAPQSTGIGKYRWPVNGAVIAGFGQNVEGSRNDGINISVPEGTPIKAAENGVVIYAGNGLKQLGNTVLVRHDDGKVTVYGHAGSLNVSRGQKVTRGQTVATSGMSGDAKRPQVHFEVRKDATPVNPITFLE